MACGILQIVVFLVLLALLAKPLGTYMAHVFRGERTFLHPVLRPVERLIYRLCGVDEKREMGVVGYVLALLVFNFVVLLFIYAILRLQGLLPLNPAHVPGMSAWDAFNTAVSFVTNTNWQAYVPETAVSYLTQMVGARVAELRLGRGRASRSPSRSSAASRAARSREIGNFWVDLTRSFLYVLLPISRRRRAACSSRRASSRTSTRPRRSRRSRARRRRSRRGRSPRRRPSRSSARTAAASSTPTRRIRSRTRRRSRTSSRCWRSSPSRPAFTYMFGKFAGNQRQGWALFAAAMVLFVLGRRRDVRERAGRQPEPGEGRRRPGGHGRCSPAATWRARRSASASRSSALWATSTTDASCGAVNASHDSLTPLAGGMAMLNIALGEIVFGGVGVGVYGHARLRDPRGVHRRADGRAHARVPGQEDRGPTR